MKVTWGSSYMIYEFNQFVDAFRCACESAPLSVSAVSEDVSVSLVDFAILGDVLSGLECGPAGAFTQQTISDVLVSKN